jgi:hypothetical protein
VDIIPAQGRDSFFACARIGIEDMQWTKPGEPRAAERQQRCDPRKSIAERYSEGDDYLARYTKAVDELVKQRWILPEDRPTLLLRSQLEWAEAPK